MTLQLLDNTKDWNLRCLFDTILEEKKVIAQSTVYTTCIFNMKEEK